MKTPLRSLGRMWVAVIATGTFGALAAGEALAAHVSCGDTITVDTTLDSDLNCTGDGLIVDADGITLDLDGFRILGDADPGDEGVRVLGSFVVIRNGNIGDFGVGIVVSGNSNTVEDLAIANTFGNGGTIGSGSILVFGATNTIQRNTITFASNGIQVLSLLANDNLIRENHIQDCITGIRLTPANSFGNTLLGNILRGNTVTLNLAGIVIEPYLPGGLILPQDTLVRNNDVTKNFGIGIEVGTEGNTIRANTVADNSTTGILVTDRSNTIRANTVTDNFGTGILVTDSSNILSGNDVNDNVLHGIHLTSDGGTADGTTVGVNHLLRNGGHGVLIETSGNILRRNTVRSNGGNGFSVAGDNNVVRNNTIKRNEGHGIQVGLGANGTLLNSNTTRENTLAGVSVADNAAGTIIRSNTARQNGTSGIEINGGATLDSNRAPGNTTFGYDTSGGIMDLGGNRARGNGTANCSTQADFPNSPQAC